MTRGRLTVLAAIAVSTSFQSEATAHSEFAYRPPGELIGGSGQGRVDDTVYAPGIRFPIAEGPAYANSQVWGVGGMYGPPGSTCAAANFSFPWRDNYCETRSWDMPLCPAGSGHQGVDIRAATCQPNVHTIVAATAGTVTNIGNYSVYITADDGTRYDYLHGNHIVVKLGDRVRRGDVIGKVSNIFTDDAWTTTHLHFNIRQDVGDLGFVYVPPYTSLVASYLRLLDPAGEVRGRIDTVTCDRIAGWASDAAVKHDVLAVRAYFGGRSGGSRVLGLEIAADRHRTDLCTELDSCEHAFDLEVPMWVRDGVERSVHVYAVSPKGGVEVELTNSPVTLACAPPPVHEGVLRPIGGPEVLSAWGFSSVWQVAKVDDAALTDRVVGPALPIEPLLVRRQQSSDVWLVDLPYRRRVPDLDTARQWGFDRATAQVLPDEFIDALPEGRPLRRTPFIVRSRDSQMYLVDDDPTPAPPEDELETTGAFGGSTGVTEWEAGSSSGAAVGEVATGTGCAVTQPRGGRWGQLALLGLLACGLRRRLYRASIARPLP